MNKILFIQLLISFFVGGGIVAFLSLLAERSSEKIAGIIIAFPSTIAISLFFIGWTLSPQKVSEVATIVPIAIGIMMLFLATYLYLSRIRLSKKYSLLLCASGSLLLWFILAVPLAIWQFSSLTFSLIAYVVLTLIGYYLITVRPHEKSDHVLLKYTTQQKIWRASFAGFIIALTVLMAKSFGPFWGGIFTGFPAVFFAALTTLHYHYDSRFLFKVWKNAPLGTLTLVTYSLIAKYAFPAAGIFYGTLIAYGVSILVFYFLTLIRNFSRKKIRN